MIHNGELFNGQAKELCPAGHTVYGGIAASGAAIWYARERNSSGMISSQVTISFAKATPANLANVEFRIRDWGCPSQDLAVAGKYALAVHSDDLRDLRAMGWTNEQIGAAIRAGRAIAS